MKLKWIKDKEAPPGPPYGEYWNAQVNDNVKWTVGRASGAVFAVLWVKGWATNMIRKEPFENIQAAKRFAQRVTNKMWPDDEKVRTLCQKARGAKQHTDFR